MGPALVMKQFMNSPYHCSAQKRLLDNPQPGMLRNHIRRICQENDRAALFQDFADRDLPLFKNFVINHYALNAVRKTEQLIKAVQQPHPVAFGFEHEAKREPES